MDWLKSMIGQSDDTLEKNTNTKSSHRDFPATLESELNNTNAERQKVFDPALKQFLHGYRAGEPVFSTTEDQTRWQNARSKVLHHILCCIHNSECAENVILRGSVLLRSWLGEKARQPGDLDWVVTPQFWKYSEQRSKELMVKIVQSIRGSQVTDDIQIPDQPFASDEIWTYEKAPGWRVIVPWIGVIEKIKGTVQMDFVFGEYVPSRPVSTEVTIDELTPIRMQTASPAQSLAWKLMWLATDAYAIGKDLYDSVQLAEHIPIDAQLLIDTFKQEETEYYNPLKEFNPDEIRNWDVEWEDFIKEYPSVTGTDSDWKERLIKALEPLFRELDHLKKDS